MSVPWSVAVSVAESLAGTHPLAESYHFEALASEAESLVRRAEDMVASETGLATSGVPDVKVVGRAAWVRRNVDFFAAILPTEINGATSSGRRLAERLTAAETGALLGFMSRKVLGQYELVLPTESDSGDAVYLIAPNVFALERAHQLRPSEFRFWLALHECTHRLQFVGIGWLRDYFYGLVNELVSSHGPEAGRLRRIATEIRQASQNNEPIVGEAGLIGMLASPHQMDVLDRVQALMAMLEGHGHVVMDRIGERTLITNKRMSNLLKARRKDPRTAAFYRLTGLEMKMRQYELGENFILDVERRAGWATIGLAWQSPETLPTLRELEDPNAWLARVA